MLFQIKTHQTDSPLHMITQSSRTQRRMPLFKQQQQSMLESMLSSRIFPHGNSLQPQYLKYLSISMYKEVKNKVKDSYCLLHPLSHFIAYVLHKNSQSDLAFKDEKDNQRDIE